MEPWPDRLNQDKFYLLCDIHSIAQLFRVYHQKCYLAPISYTSFYYYLDLIAPHIQIKFNKNDVCVDCNKFRVELMDKPNELTRNNWVNHIGESQKRRRIYELDCKLNDCTVLSFDYKLAATLPNEVLQSDFLYF